MKSVSRKIEALTDIEANPWTFLYTWIDFLLQQQLF